MDIGLHLQNILNCYLCTLKATGVNSFKIIGVVQACFTTDLQLIVNCIQARHVDSPGDRDHGLYLEQGGDGSEDDVL